MSSGVLTRPTTATGTCTLALAPCPPASATSWTTTVRPSLVVPCRPLTDTVPDWLATSPDIRAAPLPPATEDDLPLDTFIALNNGTGAREPLVFSNDEAALGEDHVSRWLRWGTFAVPQAPDSADTSTTTHFYLEPTEEEQTFRVTWRTPGTPDGGLQRVNLTAQLPSAVPPPTN